MLASLADRYHDVPQPSSSSPSSAARAGEERKTESRRRRAATISPPLSSVGSSPSSEGWSSPGAFDRRGRRRGSSFSTPGTSVSLWSGEGGGVAGGVVGGNGNGNGAGAGAGGLGGYGYNIPFVQAPQLPLFAAHGGAAAAVSESGSGSGGSGSEASTVSEYWTNGVGGGGGGGGGGRRYWNDTSPVGSRGEMRRAGGGVVGSWGEGRRGGNWEGVGYVTVGGLRETRERTERGVGRLEGEIARARAGAGGYRLWSWE